MKHIFIINAISGKGKALDIVSTIEDIANDLELDYEIRITKHPNHAFEITKEYNGSKDITIYAVGGDGTVYEVLNGLDENITMAIIPCGSGNDFYRIFNNDKIDYHTLIKDTINAKTFRIDYGIANGKKFINTSSLGIDSDVTAYASKLIRNTFITKGPAYVLSIIKNVIIPKSKELTIDYDGHILNGRYYIACIMNGQYYGNGVRSAPNSIIDDGFFDFIIAKKCNFFAVYPLLIKYLNSRHLNNKHFEIIKAKNIKIKSKDAFSIQMDGEMSHDNILDIHIKEKGLLFKVPNFKNS